MSRRVAWLFPDACCVRCGIYLALAVVALAVGDFAVAVGCLILGRIELLDRRRPA